MTRAPAMPWPTAGGLPSVRVPPCVWYAAAAFTLLTTSGAIFGWVSMASLLTTEGAFAEGCPAPPSGGGPAAPCKQQQLELNAVYTAASVLSYTAPVPLGAFLDARGPRATLLLCLAIFSAGVALIIAATVSGVHALYYPGFMGLGAAASSSITPLYSTANLFPGREGLLLAVLNGCFDAGSLVFQTMAGLAAAGVPLATVWGAYAGGPLAVSWLLAALLWRRERFPVLPPPSPPPPPSEEPHKQPQPPLVAVAPGAAAVATVTAAADAATTGGGGAEGRPCAGGTRGATTDAHGVPVVVSSGADECASPAAHLAATAVPPHVAGSGDGAASDLPGGSAPRTSVADSAAAAAAAAAAGRGLEGGGFDVAALHALPFSAQLRTVEFCAFAAAFIAWMLRFNVFIGSVHPQMDALGQAPSGDYTRLFGTILPLGFFAQPAIGALLDTSGGTLSGLWALWALGVVFSCLNSWLPLAGQPASFVVFACFRGFLFTNMSSYCARVFGFRTLGRTIGTLVLLGGLVSLLQLALLPWAYAGGSGGDGAADFSRVNALLLALCAATVALPLWLTLRGASARRRASAGGGGASSSPRGDAAGRAEAA